MNKDVCNRLSLSIITQVENELSYFAGVCKENPIRKMRDLPDGIRQFYTEVLNWQDYIPRFRRLLQHNIRMSMPELHESVNPDDFPLTFLPNHRPAMNALIAKGDEAELKDLEYEADSPVKSDLFAHTPPASVKSDFLAYKGATSLKGTEAMQETYPVPQEILLELRQLLRDGNWPISGQNTERQNVEKEDRADDLAKKPSGTLSPAVRKFKAFDELWEMYRFFGHDPKFERLSPEVKQYYSQFLDRGRDFFSRWIESVQADMLCECGDVLTAEQRDRFTTVVVDLLDFTLRKEADGGRVWAELREDKRELVNEVVEEMRPVRWRLKVAKDAEAKGAGISGEEKPPATKDSEKRLIPERPSDIASHQPKQESDATPKKPLWVRVTGVGAIALLIICTVYLIVAYVEGNNFVQKALNAWQLVVLAFCLCVAIVAYLVGWDKIRKIWPF